ncbi:MAG: hypothetical protein RLZZ31_741 [Actinomycetota bacterium]
MARLVPDASFRRFEEGRAILGGSPLTVLRLSEKGAEVVDRLLGGEDVDLLAPPKTGEAKLLRRFLDAGIFHPVSETSPYTTDDVTIVIPVKGEIETGLLDGLGHAQRIIVVDDGSDLPLQVPEKNRYGVPIECVRHEKNEGPAAARMTGLRLVKTPLVAFVDSDCLAKPGWLEPLLTNFCDHQVGIVAPRIVMNEPLGQARFSRLMRYERKRAALDQGPIAGRVRARSRIAFVPSATLVCRTSFLHQLGGFDESMPVGEDVDLVWRFDENDVLVRYDPSVTIGHRHRTTPLSWLRRRFDYGTSAGPLAKRHKGALVPVEASGLSLATWGSLAAGFPLGSAALVGITIGVLEKRVKSLPIAVELSLKGHLSAGRLIAASLVRPWWPITALALAFLPFRKLRRALLLGALALPVWEWFRTKPDVDLPSWIVLRLCDDMAYGLGVWVGSLRSGTIEPLLPDVTTWPNPSKYSRWRQQQRQS